jgi:predicted permease
MSWLVLQKLVAMFVVVAIGWWAGRARWLGEGDTARVLGNAAFMIFVPALLFRTAARLPLATLPWRTLAAFFVPTLALMLAVYAVARVHSHAQAPAHAAVRAITSVYGNAVQVGIPMAAALFGESGLGLHLTIVSLHGLVMLTVLTALVEHASGAQPSGARWQVWQTCCATCRAPVVLPLLVGLLFSNRIAAPELIDQLLQVLGSAVVRVCLVLIGLSLRHYGVRGPVRESIALTAIKLIVMPACVAARALVRPVRQALAVVVLMAALPVGSNAVIFAQRYRTDEAAPPRRS